MLTDEAEEYWHKAGKKDTKLILTTVFTSPQCLSVIVANKDQHRRAQYPEEFPFGRDVDMMHRFRTIDEMSRGIPEYQGGYHKQKKAEKTETTLEVPDCTMEDYDADSEYEELEPIPEEQAAMHN